MLPPPYNNMQVALQWDTAHTEGSHVTPHCSHCVAMSGMLINAVWQLLRFEGYGLDATCGL